MGKKEWEEWGVKKGIWPFIPSWRRYNKMIKLRFEFESYEREYWEPTYKILYWPIKKNHGYKAIYNSFGQRDAAWEARMLRRKLRER